MVRPLTDAVVRIAAPGGDGGELLDARARDAVPIATTRPLRLEILKVLLAVWADRRGPDAPFLAGGEVELRDEAALVAQDGLVCGERASA